MVCECLTDPSDVDDRWRTGSSRRWRRTSRSAAGGSGAPASIGIAISDDQQHRREPAAGRGHGDVRRQAARAGRRWEPADALVHTAAVRMLCPEGELREAMPARSAPALLPADLSTCRRRGMVGVEALLRWQHPTRGLVLPRTLIDVAERRNLIGAIGSWVLQTACTQAACWVHRYGRRRAADGREHLLPAAGRPRADRSRCSNCCGSTGLPAGAALPGDHRDPVHRRGDVRDHRSARPLRAPGSRSPSTTSAPGSPGSTTCAGCRSTPSRSTSPTSTDWASTRPTRPSWPAWSPSPAASACSPSPRASRARSVPRPAQLGCTEGQGWLWHPALPAEEVERLIAADHGR